MNQREKLEASFHKTLTLTFFSAWYRLLKEGKTVFFPILTEIITLSCDTCVMCEINKSASLLIKQHLDPS